MSRPRRVAIVGGGLSGLATAYRLQASARAEGLAVEIRVFEASSRCGGKIVTETTDGFLLEGGPDSFITRKPWLLELIRELGLEGAVVETPNERGGVYVLRQGRLIPLPEGMLFVVPTDLAAFEASSLLSPEGKRRVLAEMEGDRRPQDPAAEQSLANFVRRRFGDEALDFVAEPLMAGIHAADPETLSLTAAFPQVAQADLRFPSLIRGLQEAHHHRGLSPSEAKTRNSSRVTLRGGLETLIQELVDRLEPGVVQLNAEVLGVENSGEGFRLALESGTFFEADALVLTTPAFVAARLVNGLAPQLAEELHSIRYVSSATVSLGFSAAAVGHPLDGLGFVVPRVEGRQIRACTWSSSKFDGRAPQDHVLLRVFLGGAFAPELVELDDAALERLAFDELRDILDLRSDPSLTRIHRWRQGIPQQEIGHLQRVQRIEAGCPEGLVLVGNAYHGVGLPDCVRSASLGSAAIWQILASRELRIP